MGTLLNWQLINEVLPTVNKYEKSFPTSLVTRKTREMKIKSTHHKNSNEKRMMYGRKCVW